jgi:hypothetical protein
VSPNDGPMLMEFIGIPMFPTILKQLAGVNI